MSTPAERQQNAERVSALIAMAAKGNRSAEDYLRTIAGAARVLDDLIDRDVEIAPDQIVNCFAGLLVGLQFNEFFLSNRASLSMLHQVALNAWLDANEWEHADSPDKRIYAQVLRDLVNEILPTVAYLTGGWAHMRTVSRQTRELFLKEIQ